MLSSYPAVETATVMNVSLHLDILVLFASLAQSQSFDKSLLQRQSALWKQKESADVKEKCEKKIQFQCIFDTSVTTN